MAYPFIDTDVIVRSPRTEIIHINIWQPRASSSKSKEEN